LYSFYNESQRDVLYLKFSLAGETRVKEPQEKPKRRWLDNIRKDLQEVGCGYMDWIGLAQARDR